MQVGLLLMVSAVVMGISYTITHERIFEPFRRLLGGKDTFIGYLCSCPYCFSHWVAFVVVPLTGAYVVPIAHDWGIASKLLSWFFSSILVTVIAAFMRVAFYFVDETQGLVRREQKVKEKEIEACESEAEAAGRASEHAAVRPARRRASITR